MYGMGVDTLKVARTLEKAGFDSAQAEALVAAFGGPVAGGAATREDLRDLRNASREDTREILAEFASMREQMDVMQADIADLKTGLVKFRAAFQNDIKSMKIHLYWLLLAQTVLIVGLVLALERLF